MQSGHFIALLNHGIALALSAAFLALWLYQRQRRYLAFLALGYACTALGFLMQIISPFGFALSRMLSCTAFLVGCCCISGAIIAGYGRRVPFVVLGLLSAAGIASFFWFMFIEPNLIWRVYALNVALGGISLVAAAELRPVSRNGTIETIVFVLALLSGLNFLARTLLALWIDGPDVSYSGFHQSVYWTSALLSQALVAIVLAFCLFGSATLDVVRSLQADSRTDPLSGLLNRRGLAEKAPPFFSPSKRSPSAIGLVLADLDHFKRINDTYGHAAGDAAIVAFARLLRQHGADKESLVARIGGEEFAVLLPNCDLAGARLFAESVRTGLSAVAPEAFADHQVPLTCSFGVAERVNGEDLNALIERADEALMQAKRAGRDRVRVTYLRPAAGMLLHAAA
ncbi:GGDEF domain-containing protein [Pseudaminobacter sp. 19-2017]|uniref:diguanylate cyclase n=1 Tax=Pseudaminobacter soli (ex Zhang et al. 2022) TaxID=2831468 RepID=A0A942I1F3_9HYPH|nr:GGDEF domain-containing protein [Pseudaminobacter soli]MBS3647882.1 GGDEF domain-containing protein [Pseudaminobacter soli]